MKTAVVFTFLFMNIVALGRVHNYSFPEQIKIADVIVEAKISVSNDVPYADVLNVLRGNPPKCFPIAYMKFRFRNSPNWSKYCNYDKVLLFLKNNANESQYVESNDNEIPAPEKIYEIVGGDLKNAYRAIGYNYNSFWPKLTERYDYSELMRNFYFFQSIADDADSEKVFNKLLFAARFSRPFTKNAIDNNKIQKIIYSASVREEKSVDDFLMKNYKVTEYLSIKNGKQRFEFLYAEWNSFDYMKVFDTVDVVSEERYMNFIDNEIQFLGCKIFPFAAEKCLERSNDETAKQFWRYVTKTETMKNHNLWANDMPKALLSGGREQAQVRTRFLLNEYRLAIKENRGYDRIYAEMAIRAMGVFAWATVAEEAKKGDALAIKIFKDIFYKQIPNYDSLEECFKYWDRIKNRYTLPPQSPDFKGDYGLDKWKRTGK